MALVVPVTKVAKAKKKKIRDKLKTLCDEEVELSHVLQQYVSESKKVAETLYNTKNIEEFNKNYESTLTLLDRYSNDLFFIRTDLTNKLMEHFSKTCAEIDSGSSEDDCYKSVVSTDNLAECGASLLSQNGNRSSSNHNTLVKASCFSNNSGSQTFSFVQPIEEPSRQLAICDLDNGTINDGVKQPEISSNHQLSPFNDLNPNNSFASGRSSFSVSSPSFVPNSTLPIEKSSQVQSQKLHDKIKREDTQSPEERLSPNTFLTRVQGIFNASRNFYDDEAHETHSLEIKNEEDKVHIEVANEAPEDTCNTYTSSPHAELSLSMSTALNPNAPAFEAPQASVNVYNGPLLTGSGSCTLVGQSIKDEYVSDLIRETEIPMPVANSSPVPHSNVSKNHKMEPASSDKFINARVTLVNNLIDFYVLFEPDVVDKALKGIWSVFNRSKPTALQIHQWYIVAVPSQVPFRAYLTSANGQIARVLNLDIGPELDVDVSHIFEFPSVDSYKTLPYAGRCSLYEYSTVSGWNTPEVVEEFKAVCFSKVMVRPRDREANDYDSPHLVDILLVQTVENKEVYIDIKDYFSAVQEEGQRSVSATNTKMLETLSSENHVGSQERDSSSDRSTPENQFEWKASIGPPYCPDVCVEDTELIPCVISYVESPVCFYVNLCLEESGVKHLDDLEKDMNSFYSHLEMSEPVYKRAAVQPKSFWCCLKPNDPDGIIWYRVRVISFLNEDASSPDSSGMQKSVVRKRKRRNMDPSATLEVLSVDYGSTFKVALKDLKPLTKKFAEYPAMALKCSLSNIVPPEAQIYWPGESIKKFIDFATLDNVRQLKIFKKLGSSSNDESCIVDFYNEENISARTFLCNCNAACPLVPDPDVEGFDSYNPMKEDYESIRNNFATDVDDAGIALTGYADQDDSYICKQFRNTGRCHNRSCRFYHIEKKGEFTMDKDTVFHSIPISLPKNGTRLIAEISYVINPGSFFIVCPYGFKDASEFYDNENEKASPRDLLVELENKMNEFYRHTSYLDNMTLELSASMVVACKFDSTNTWHRAKIFGFNENEDVEVFFLDYGNQCVVQRKNIRQIKPQFLDLPQQAIYCCLDSIGPANKKWTKNAMDFFIQHTKDQQIYVRVVKRMGVDSLYVDLYKSANGNDIRLKNLLVSEGHAIQLKMIPRSDECDSPNSSSSESFGDFHPG